MKYILLILGCFLCVYQSIAEVQTSDILLKNAQKKLHNINTEQLENLLRKEKDLLLIDVRTESEIDEIGTLGMGQNARIPRGWLEFRIDEYANENTMIVVYCGLNLRSPLAAKTLMDMGYKNVMNYEDGYIHWRDNGGKVKLMDKAPNSVLFDYPKEVANGVYSAIGATAPPSYINSGHNNNLSFVIGDDSVLVFNAGGSYLLAEAMHTEIKKITNKPVKYVVLENAQGHAILGSLYWQEQGAKIIAHHLAKKEIKDHQKEIFSRSSRLLKDKFSKTKVVLPDQVFGDKLTLDLGGLKVEILYLGSAHSPEDIELWIPSKSLLISGDFAFNERMLPILEHTDSTTWLENWQKLLDLKPKIIIPGHGDITDIQTITEFTKDYLIYMRSEIEKILDNDGGLTDAYRINQSHFNHWDTYQELHLRNAARLYQKMEFE